MKITRFTDFIARRKAWQLFPVLTAPMIALQVLVVEKMLPLPQLGSIAETQLLHQLFQRLDVLSFIMLILLFAWLASVALVSNDLVKASFRPALRWYFAAVIYDLAYCALAVYFFPRYVLIHQGLPGPIVVMGVLATAANVYVLGFTAKSLVLAEKQSTVSISDYFGALLLMWFFPIGVWFVQPRLNKLIGAM